MIIYCATSNPGKLSEFQLAAPDFEVRKIPSLFPPPEETGTTFEENAILKAVYYGQFTNGYLFADDSGLEVDALDGAPGVHSARYAGDRATDEQNNALLLLRMRNITNRTARFVCVIALVQDGNPVKTFRRSIEGEILDAPRGSEGFGYDPLFYIPSLDQTFGQAAIAHKMLLSHRGQALSAMFAYLRDSASN
jgi:XTP/dITP diphosphohydrolase